MDTLQTEHPAAQGAPTPTPTPAPKGGAAVLALGLPAASAVGDALYLTGFWAEYTLLCAVRFLARAGGAVWKYLCRLVLLVLRPVAAAVRGFFRDLARPFVQLGNDLRTLREMAPEDEGDAQQVQAARQQYLKNSRGIYRRLLWEAFSFLLPVAAFAVLVGVVRGGLAKQYVLDVQVNGQSVGYVQSEQVFENARADVQNRLNNARMAILATGNAVEEEDWQIEPGYTLTYAEQTQTMNESEAADAIMRVSGDEIGQGTAVYVDGALQFVTTEGDHLRAYLENIKAPYEDMLDVNTRVSFLHDIRLEDGLYMLSSQEEYPGVIQAFNANPEIYYYTAGPHETAQSAVDVTGVAWDSLAMMNPDLLTLDQPIPEGTQLITGASSPEWLKVKVITRRTYTEAIPYQTEKRTSNEYDFGKKVTLQAGQTGEQEVTQDITYIDGAIADTQIVNINVLSQPVNEVIVTGTRIASGMYANPGTGSFVWPVPNYNYVSRWMSSAHKGADICANYGTPIVAADSGAVVTSANGAGSSYWSYGNYIIIDHGNGWRTLYAHMSSRAVSAGQTVSKGQVIGYVGQTGRATGPHCHFEMYYNGARYNAHNLWPSL